MLFYLQETLTLDWLFSLSDTMACVTHEMFLKCNCLLLVSRKDEEQPLIVLLEAGRTQTVMTQANTQTDMCVL